jgi:hypothetical protein
MTITKVDLIVRRVIFLAAVLCCSRLGSAQEMDPYAGATVEISTWGVHSWSGSPSATFGNTTDDTNVIGIVGEVGWFLGRNLAVGAEVEIPFGRTNVTSVHGYFNPYTRLSQYRERSVFGVFHGYTPARHRVRAGILSGGGIVFANSLDQVSSCNSNFGPNIVCTPFSPAAEATRSALGATIGGDVVVQTTRRLSVVSQFRILWVGRGGDPSSSNSQDSSFVTLGLDRVSYRAGIGLRASF